VTAPTYTAGQQLDFDDGSMVRIDMIRDGEVYFMAFRLGEETGAPTRMTVALFTEAVEVERRKRNAPPIAAFVDGDGQDYFASLRFDRVGGYLDITVTASAGGAAGMRLAKMSLDPATVAQLHAATRPETP
jgi:hypothetical protein